MGAYERRQGIERIAQSDVKLTKAGEKWAKATPKEIETLLADTTNINYNEWQGAAVNPKLPATMIRHFFAVLKTVATREKKDEEIAKATKTKNIGQREKIRRLLQEHPNLDDDAFRAIITKYKVGPIGVLNNPMIKEEHLQLFFDTQVLGKGRSGSNYSFLAFQQLLQAKNITTKLFIKWYNTLHQYADWTYSDNEWYAIVRTCLDRDDCPVEILAEIASAPNDGEEGWRSHSEPYRDDALEHKNATTDLVALAYKATGFEKYLPQIAKDIFVF